jgi:hypothetical protein
MGKKRKRVGNGILKTVRSILSLFSYPLLLHTTVSGKEVRRYLLGKKPDLEPIVTWKGGAIGIKYVRYTLE